MLFAAKGLSCTRGGRLLFSGIDLSLQPGLWAQVRGSNGAGKTSLLRQLAGLTPPDAGEVRWDGAPIARDREAYAAQRLYLGHQAAVKDELSALENLCLAAAVEGHALAADDALRALRRFGLGGREEMPARYLSAGQRGRLLLARTLTRPARLWILDEPLTALDAHAADDFMDLLQGHLADGGMAVLTSHQPLGRVPDCEVAL